MKSSHATPSSRRTFLQRAGSAAAGLALGALPSFALGAEASLKIGIIGSGRIGSALGTIWHKAGHEVMFSSLDLAHDKALAAGLGAKAHAGTSLQAAEFGEVLLMAVPYGALPKLGKELAAQIKGKVVIDACNPFPARDGEVGTWAREKGAGLASAELLPGARLVRAFNAVGAGRLPQIAAGKSGETGMPMAGDDSDAIAVASRLIREVGFEPVLVGSLAMGRHLIPGTPLAGERSAAEIRQVVATLK